MRDRDGDEFGLARRFELLAFALLLVLGCGVLALGLRAVPKAELAGAAAAVLYVFVAHLLQPAPTDPKLGVDRIRPLSEERQLSRFFIRFCLVWSFVLSLATPWAWIAFFAPSAAQVQLLGPPLFAMMVQVLFEIWSYRTTVSAFIRVTIPVAFVSYRMKLLLSWLQEALSVESTALSDRFMQLLAGANLFFWSIMLFYVLLLKVCPPYFLERKVAEQEGEGIRD